MVRPGQLPRWRQFVSRGAKRAKRRFFRRFAGDRCDANRIAPSQTLTFGVALLTWIFGCYAKRVQVCAVFFCFIGCDSWPFFVLGLFGWKNWIPDRMLTWMLLPIHWDPQSVWSQWLWRELRIWIERGDESFFGTPPSWLCFRILFCSASLDFNLFALVSWWHQGFVGVHFKPVYTLKKTLWIRKSVAWCAFIDMCCQCSGPRSTMMLSNNWGLSHCHCPHCALLGTYQAFTVGSGQRNWHRTCMPSLHLAGSMFATSMVSTILRLFFRWSYSCIGLRQISTDFRIAKVTIYGFPWMPRFVSAPVGKLLALEVGLRKEAVSHGVSFNCNLLIVRPQSWYIGKI